MSEYFRRNCEYITEFFGIMEPYISSQPFIFRLYSVDCYEFSFQLTNIKIQSLATDGELVRFVGNYSKGPYISILWVTHFRVKYRYIPSNCRIFAYISVKSLIFPHNQSIFVRYWVILDRYLGEINWNKWNIVSIFVNPTELYVLIPKYKSPWSK